MVFFSDADPLALPGMRAALAKRDIATVYQILARAGVSQRGIAHATGQSQSEVCEILKGRQVMAYDVLVRIASGLRVPREAMGLGYGVYTGGAYSGEGTAAEPGEEADAEVFRRGFTNLLALAGTAAFGTTIPGLGELSDSVTPPRIPADIPSRIGDTDVAVIRSYTGSLVAAARTLGGQARPAIALTDWADGYLKADAQDETRRALRSALSHLHAVAAGCCHDSDLPSTAVHHYGKAVRLGILAGDNFASSYALRYATNVFIVRGEPNDGLKLLQLARLHLADASPEDPRVVPLRAQILAKSAIALADMSVSDSIARSARSYLSRARDGYNPQGPRAQAVMDLSTAQVYLRLGLLDEAVEMAEASSRAFGADRRDGILAEIITAQLHVSAGDRDALRMADSVINATATLRSGVARAALKPLAMALEARPSADAGELARRARQVATTPA